jgi:hypothetical protein
MMKKYNQIHNITVSIKKLKKAELKFKNLKIVIFKIII